MTSKELIPGARSIVAVVNPVSKGGAANALRALRRAAGPGSAIRIVRTSAESPSRHEILGDAAWPDAVVAIGGDGTVAATATALAGADVAIGVIPAGSTNVIAKGLRIPTHFESAARLICEPHAELRIDSGVCGERRFLHMGGMGLDTRMFLSTNKRLKRRIGWPAYAGGMLSAVREPPSQIAVTVDGVTVMETRSPLVLVANGNFIVHPILRLFSDIVLDDGLLDVLVFTATNPLQIGRTMSRLATRTLRHSPYVTRFRGAHIRVDATPGLPLELDGDPIGETPAEFVVEPRSVRVIVPG